MELVSDGRLCACGKVHRDPVQDVIIGPGALEQLPELIARLGAAKPFLLADRNTDEPAGARIRAILDEELPTSHDLERMMRAVGLPTSCAELGVDRACAQMTFRATKDIRDKYVLSRLAWDLSILDELCQTL